MAYYSSYPAMGFTAPNGMYSYGGFNPGFFPEPAATPPSSVAFDSPGPSGSMPHCPRQPRSQDGNPAPQVRCDSAGASCSRVG